MDTFKSADDLGITAEEYFALIGVLDDLKTDEAPATIDMGRSNECLGALMNQKMGFPKYLRSAHSSPLTNLFWGFSYNKVPTPMVTTALQHFL